LEAALDLGRSNNSITSRVRHPVIIRYFLDHGADIITGSSFAVAFGDRIQRWRGL